MSDYAAPYPFPTGYAEIADVAARINAGTWNPSNDSTSSPTAGQVNQFLIEATAEVDMVLRKTGYFVPLQMQGGYPASPLPPTVLTKLQVITAALASAMVEKVRHGSATQESDQVGSDWKKLADGLLARLQDGSDNFPPQPDQSRGATWTGQTDSSGNANVPLFNRSQSF